LNKEALKGKIEHYQLKARATSPVDFLVYCLHQHPGKAAFSTSLGAEDQVITHLLAGTGIPVRIFTLDTGRLFQETYDLIQITRQRYHLPFEIYFPDARAVERMVNKKGINLFYDSIDNRKLCCHIRKIEPLKRALKDMDIWITGLRRDQSVTRGDSLMVEWDDGLQVIKVNPLIEWSNSQVWDFIRGNKIPYNTLHDRGFPSIGCLPCTRAVLPGENIRAGRWWWEDPDARECGLHVNNK